MHKDGTVTSAEIWWLGLSRKWWVLAAVGVVTSMVRGRSPAQMEMAGSGQPSPSSRLH